MGLFDNVFKKNASSENEPSKYHSYIEILNKPALKLGLSEQKAFSKIGGLPILQKGMQWPSWKDKPMAFLCQFDLTTIPGDDSFPKYPTSGFLSFFYDQDQSTWGFDPKDKGSWKVIYSENCIDCKEVAHPTGMQQLPYKEKFIKYSKIFTYPNWEDDRIRNLKMSDSQSKWFDEFYSSAFSNAPNHQLFGYPLPEQGAEMPLQCQLVTHGIYCGDSAGYHDPRAKELEKGIDNWVLFLQLDSDDDVGMMWGDAGKLYFWIKKDDLINYNFDNIWMILQCG